MSSELTKLHNSENDFEALAHSLGEGFGNEFKALETAQQLFPDSLRLDNSNVGLIDGGLLVSFREVETQFDEPCHILSFSRPNKTEFEVIFPHRIFQKMEEMGWLVGNVIAFQWRGYLQLPKGKKMKNLAIVKLGEVNDVQPSKKSKK